MRDVGRASFFFFLLTNCLIAEVSFVAKGIFPSLSFFCSFVKKSVWQFVHFLFQLFYSILLIYLFILSPLTYCLVYHSFTVSSEVGVIVVFSIILVSGSLVSPYKFVGIHKITFWDFDWDFIESIDQLGITNISTILSFYP